MRKLRGAAFVSLDGVIQGPGGMSEDPTGGFAHGGWVFGVGDEGINATLEQLFAPPYALLLGRRTYDIFAAYWPHVDPDGMGSALTRADKYVVTRGDQPLEWSNTHRLGGIDAVAALKASAGPDLLIQGSSTLYPPLLAAGLIDELVLMTFPVLLGGGKRLFGAGTPAASMRLVDHAIGDKGVVITRWQPAGALPAGEHPAPVDSAAERARQTLMREGRW